MAIGGRKPVPAAKVAEFFRLIDSGVSRDRAAREVGIPTGTAATLLHRRNVQQREEKRAQRDLQPPGTG